MFGARSATCEAAFMEMALEKKKTQRKNADAMQKRVDEEMGEDEEQERGAINCILFTLH